MQQYLRIAGNTLRVSYQRWGAGNQKKVLCLHGWLDNSNSFSYLGPYLAQRNYEVVAIDHIGHGRSDHFHQLSSFSIFASHCLSIQEALGWDKSHVVGHSMGANVSVLYAGSFPQRVERLVLIEGIGQPTEKAENAAKNFRKAVLAERLAFEKGKGKSTSSSRKVYNSMQEAIAARIAAVATYPGRQTLSPEAALAIVSRGARRVESGEDSPIDDKHLDPNDSSIGPVSFYYDQKLLLPTIVSFTEEEVESFIRAIRSPTLFVSAENGWPLKRVPDRKQLFAEGLLQHVHLPGSHHLHLDPEHATACAELVGSFLDKA